MKKILTLDVCGFPYTVYAVDPSKVPGMDDTDEGYTQTETCKIFINRDVQPCRFREVLLHEIIHAIFDATGICYMIQLYLPDNSEANGIFEELIVRALTPALRTTLRQVPKVLK